MQAFDAAALSLAGNPQIDLGLAIDSPDGLFVPVLRDVGRTGPADWRRQIDAFKTGVRERSLAPAELRNPTITLSNFGTIAGQHAALVIVPPQVAILGAGRIIERAVRSETGLRLHRMLPLSLTFDHRAITGGEAARFLRAVMADLEKPGLIEGLIMDDTFRFADAFGPSRIIHIHRPSVGLKAIVVVDNTACGVAIGGVRMAPDVTVEECFRLARAMTWKNAAAGLRHGGGKSVISADPRMPAGDKENLIRAFAGAIRDIGDYVPGPDMGTDELCMGWIKDETGRAVGLPRAIGGIPLDEIGATGFGVAACVDVAAGFHRSRSQGCARRGAGVRRGWQACRALSREKGAVLVGASDTNGTLADPTGLDIAALIALKEGGGSLRDHPLGEKLPGDAVIDIPCDIWIPAARPDVINARNVCAPADPAGGARRQYSVHGGSGAGAAPARRSGIARFHRQCRRGDLCRHRIPGRDRESGIRIHRRTYPREHPDGPRRRPAQEHAAAHGRAGARRKKSARSRRNAPVALIRKLLAGLEVNQKGLAPHALRWVYLTERRDLHHCPQGAPRPRSSAAQVRPIAV